MGLREDAVAVLPVEIYDWAVEQGAATREAQTRGLGEGAPILEGQRSDTLFSLALVLARRGLDVELILPSIRETNERRCKPPLDDLEVVKQVEGAVRWAAKPSPADEALRSRARQMLEERKARAVEISADSRARAPVQKRAKRTLVPFGSSGAGVAQRKPAEIYPGSGFAAPELEEAAFHGLAAEWAREVEPYSEASPDVVHAVALIAFGNAAGHTPCMRVGVTAHHANEFGLLVGHTATGRKGDAINIGTYPIKHADRSWSPARVQSGFGSGEAIVWELRDAAPGGEDENVDPGALDKRLLISEGEFAHVVAVARREGSTLSALLRNAWDGVPLANRTKRARIVASGAHLSILAAITPEELLRHVSETDLCNGFLNRFVLLGSARSRLLPSPPSLPPALEQRYVALFADRLERARTTHELRRDAAADALWAHVYTTELSVDRFGLAGAVCSRAESHALRFSELYALLDGAGVVRIEHVQAARALWRFCEETAYRLFGDRMGDTVADTSLFSLAEAGADGLTKTDLREPLSNRERARLDEVLAHLVAAGRVTAVQEHTGGRPATRYYLAEHAPPERSTDDTE